ncbi:MAG TPA: aminoglycoside phosphotransferase family protein [Nocardioides sp.]|nr:aminoglycoside phosphotransferase family protein [Nocardioides sp.]
MTGPSARAAAILEEWRLTPDGPAFAGTTAHVLPVRTDAGERAVLKLGRERTDEHLALQRWSGGGAVRMLRADPGRGALLLERLGAEDLGEHWDVQACEVVGDLYRRLHVAAGPQLAPLSFLCTAWADELSVADLPMPRRMVEQARALARDLASDEATDGVLIHTDLHYGHVLAARDDDGWRAIAPKPLAGDPHYEPAPLLWSRWDELAGRVRAGVRDRFLAVVDAAGLDEHRARDWVIVRTVVAVLEEVRDRSTPDRARITALLAIAKAVQD